MKKLVKNKIRCKHCGDVIESKSIHDWVQCSCEACFVDGGLTYLRRGFRVSPEEDYEELSEYEDVPGFHVEYLHKGISWTEPYETDLPESINHILWRFPQSQYYLKITDEDGNVVIDTLTNYKEEN